MPNTLRIERFHIFTCLIYVKQKCVVWRAKQGAKLSTFDSAATTDGQGAKPLQYGYHLS